MTTVATDPLVDDYLRRLDAAASGLPPHRRAELLSEIREHVHDALGETATADEVAVRNVLERLGPPEEIAHAAADPAEPLTAQPSDFGVLEIAALVVLAVFPVVGWVLGPILVLLSQAWSTRDKLTALLGPLLAGLAPMLVVMSGPGGVGLGPLEVGVLFLPFLGGPLAAAYLAWRLRGRYARTRGA